MKKTAFLCAFLALLISSACHAGDPANPAAGIKGIHNARNSLDYEGIYRPHAFIPADGLSEIKIKPNQRYCYMTGTGAKITGTFHWDASGSRIILNHATKTPLVFFVGENHLKLLSKGSQEGLVFQKEME